MAITLQSIDPATATEPTAPTFATPPAPAADTLASAPPLATLSRLAVEDPQQQAERDFQEKTAQWRGDSQRKIDGVILDPQPYFKDKPMGFDADPKRAQILALNSAVMDLHGDGSEVPTDDTALPRKILLQDTSRRLYGDTGPVTEESFHALNLTAAQGRKDQGKMATWLDTQAQHSAILDSIHEANLASWPATLKTLQAMPGYDKTRQAQYLQEFNDFQTQTRDAVDSFADPLGKVWWAMKEFDPNGPAAANPDPGSVAKQEFDNLAPEDRPKFMDALGTLAKNMPQEKRAEFFRNLGMASSRVPADLANDAFKFWEVMQNGPVTGGPIATSPGGVVPSADTLARSNQGRKDTFARIDFADEVRRIARDDFAPTAHVTKDGTWARTAEDWAYGTPGLLGFTAEAALPVVGQALMFSSMGGQAYSTVRDNLKAGGMESDKAGQYAAALAPVVAIPQAILMHYVSSQWLGKLPVLNGVLTKLGDQIENRAVRFAMKAGTGALTGTAAMDAMNLVPSAVQDIGHALDQEMPYQQWTGKGGAFDAAFAGSLDTFLLMLPLSMFGAAGGMDAEARNRAFAEATPTQRAAFGITTEHSLKIYEADARGPASLSAAVDAALAGRDPNSPEAVAAVATLKEQCQRQQHAQQQLEQLGISAPRLTHNPDGTVDVHDGVTGEHWGSAPDNPGALRLVQEHSTALDGLHADQIAAIGTMMEAARAAVKIDPNSKTVLELGKIITTANLGDLSPEAADRIAFQMVLEEQAQGGTGGVTRSVLGSSQSEFRNGLRETTNKIYAGGSILDVFHETGHGLSEQASADGTLTRADDIAILRALDAIYAGKTTREGRDAQGNVIGQGLRFIPEGMADADIPEALLQEAKSKILEMEILRTRKAGNGQPIDRAATGFAVPVGKLGVPRGVISRNLAALARLAPESTGRFKAFVEAFRTRWGISMARVVHLEKAAREGTFDKASYDTYVDKLLGIDQQKAHEARVRTEQDRIFNLPDDLPGDAIQFSLGGKSGEDPSIFKADLHAQAEWLLDLAGKKGHKSLDEWFKKDPEAYNDHTLKWREAHPRTEGGDAHRTGNPEGAGSGQGESGKGALGSSEHLDAGASVAGIDPKATGGEKSGDAVAPALFEESNRIANLNPTGATMAAIRRENPGFDPTRPTVTVYRATIGDSLRPNDFVALNKDIANEHLQNLKDRGETGKLISVEVPTKDLLMANDATEFIYYPQDFEQSPPAKSGEQFSLGPAEVAGILSGDALARVKDPLRRAQAMSRIARNFQDLQVSTDRALLLAKSKRGKGDLKREAALQEELLADQYVGEAYARHQGILSNDDLTKIKQQPGHLFLADPDSHLRGRLMSKAAAIKQHPDMFVINRPGDYDGADGISRSVFGGQLMPDQAAQEMFDNHLIKEPTPDAMWALLAKEQSTVAKMKESLVTAQADVRAAKLQAKTEANAWLSERVGDQEANFSQKEQILRGLAQLDAILAALPPDLRGKLGGYTQMARIGTDEIRLEYLQEKLAKADSEMGKWLKESFGKEFEDLMQRSRPAKDGEGQRPTGKIGADTHDLFRSMEHSMWLDSAAVEEKISALEKALERPDLTADQEAHLQLELGMTALVGDWRKASAARREQALLEAMRIYEGGYMRRKIQLAYEREDRATNRAALQKDTGKAGTAGERDRKLLDDNGVKGKWAGSLLSLGSFEQITTYLFGESSATARRLVDQERRASHSKSDAIHAKSESLSALFTRLAGGVVKGQQMQWEMHQKSLTIGERNLSPLDAITASLMWRQDDGKRHMLGHLDDAGKPVGEWHYDQAWMDQLEAALSPEAKEVRAHLADEYGREYDRINAVFRDLYGVNMPRNPFYSPLTVKPISEAAGQVIDPVSGFGMQGMSLTPGSLRTRAQTAIAEPDFRDAAQVFISHVKQMEHFIAYGKFTKEALGLINSRDVINSVEAKGGQAGRGVLKDWMDYFAQGGNRDAGAHLELNQLLSRMTGRAASSILIGKAGVIAIQSVQLGGALAEMPAGSYAVRLAKLMTGQMGWGAALKSEYIQRRLQELPVMVRLAVDGLQASRPSQLKHAIGKIGGLIGGADALFTAGTYSIIYDYQLKQAKELGIANPEAYAREEAERGCDRVAQPTRPGTRSMLENRSNVYTKLAWAFASEARQKIALTGFTLANPDASAGRKARAFALTWIVGGMITSLIRAAKRDLLDGSGDEVFDDKNWNLKSLVLNTLTGPLQGVPVLGDEITSAINAAAGGYSPEGNIFSDAKQAAKSVTHVPEWFTGERDASGIMKDVDSILSGLALGSDRMSEYASLSHMAKDAFGLSKQVTGN